MSVSYVLKQLEIVGRMIESINNHGGEINKFNDFYKCLNSTGGILEKVLTDLINKKTISEEIKNDLIDTLDELIQAMKSIETARQKIVENVETLKSMIN